MIRPITVTVFLLLLTIHSLLPAQPGADAMKFPWAGGLNACQAGNIDINLDNQTDLLIFDRQGNRILPFIATPGGWSLETNNTSLFPGLHDWILVEDYDRDGRQDIFTYSLGGIRVFRNISDTVLKFELVTDLLESYYYNGYVGILVTAVDRPAVADIDGDGDLDILTFFGLGSYVEYHQNMSMERYGTADSLDYRLADNCFGDFRESEGGNRIELNVTCPNKYGFHPEVSCLLSDPKHTGSTLWATDLDGSGTSDLVIGDVDFPNLIALYNGGTADTAHMTSLDSLFPGGANSVNLCNFPVCSQVVTDPGSGLAGLLVSPFDPQTFHAENYNCLWSYRNTGTATAPVYELENRRFLLDEMIDLGSNALPRFYDVDGDSRMDLIAGNYGYYDTSWLSQGILHTRFISRIAWYRNNAGSTAAGFIEVTDDLGELSTCKFTALCPAPGDPDGDGDMDLITGKEDGTLLYLNNTAGPGQIPVFDEPVLNYDSIDVGDFSTPQLFDLDRDGLQDLIIGERNGNLNYYRNTGTPSHPAFIKVTDSLGKVNVTNPALSYYGFSVPWFFRTGTGPTLLVVGSEEGKLYFYPDIDGNLQGTFTPSDTLYRMTGGVTLPQLYGWRSAPACIPSNQSGGFDLVVGNLSGGLNYFSPAALPSVAGVADPAGTEAPPFFSVYPNPADKELTVCLNEPPVNPVSIIIRNSVGQILVQMVSRNRNTLLDTSGFPPGLYLVGVAGTVDNPGFRTGLKKVIILH